MTKLDEKHEAKLREVSERFLLQPSATFAAIDDALRDCFRLGWEARNDKTPHWTLDPKERWTCKSARSPDHDKADCIALGGRCRSFASEEGIKLNAYCHSCRVRMQINDGTFDCPMCGCTVQFDRLEGR